jgi:hypothetical protein
MFSDPTRRHAALVAVAITAVTVTAFAAMYWKSPWKANACTAIGKRQYSSRLMDIPWGQSWEQACANMPATIHGQNFARPTRWSTTPALGESSTRSWIMPALPVGVRGSETAVGHGGNGSTPRGSKFLQGSIGWRPAGALRYN